MLLSDIISTSISLWEEWQSHALKRPDAEAIVHWTVGEAPFRWKRAELIRASTRYSQGLRERGVKPGDVCAIMLKHHPEFYPIYLGVVAIGAIPAVLSYPNPRLHPDKFRQGITGMSKTSGLDWLLTGSDLAPVVAPLVAEKSSTIRDIFFPLDWEAPKDAPVPSSENRPVLSPDSTCLLQHSSGTTGLQKAVALSHRAVLTHIQNYGRAIDLGPEDKVASWLPLYHDMGLIATFHLPLAFGIPTIMINPFEWVIAPAILLEAISQEKATLTWLPNFAYNLMTDRIRDEDLAGVRLDSLRAVINCSEPIRAESHDKFIRRFSRLGLKRGALSTCYAMAETTFAVTQSEMNKEARTLAASREELARGVFRPAKSHESARACVSSGKMIPGCVGRIVDTDDRELPEGQVGESQPDPDRPTDALGHRCEPVDGLAKRLRQRMAKALVDARDQLVVPCVEHDPRRNGLGGDFVHRTPPGDDEPRRDRPGFN